MNKVLKRKIAYLIGRISPQLVIRMRYKKLFGKSLNLAVPQDLNEKIQWLKLYSDTSRWVELADKYRVRKYVEECGCADLLCDFYAVWHSVDEINFSSLPQSFVLKSNNGCGTVMLVKDKSKMGNVRPLLRKWMKLRWGYETGELHYLKIKPCILAEEYLEQDGDISSSLVDYKIDCIYGKAVNMLVCYDREIGGRATFDIYDLTTWKRMPQVITEKFKKGAVYKDIPRPASLERMLEACHQLAKDIPLVRIDFYEVNGKAYFGEMTFTSRGGFMDYLTPEYLKELGDQLILPPRVR